MIKKLTNRQRKSQKKRLDWLVSATRWRRLGEETMEEEVLVTRIGRKPPRYRLEHFIQVDGEPRAKVAMLVKAAKGTKGYDVVVGEDGAAFRAPTRRKAIMAFAALAAKLEEDNDQDMEG